MYLSDLNRLEKYLAKFKDCVNAGHEPSLEETNAMQLVQNQIQQIEEILFNLRAAKGSVAGLLLKSLQDARPQSLSAMYFTSNEKGFSIFIPTYHLFNNPEHNNYSQGYYDWHRAISEWATNVTRASQRHYSGQDVPESEIQLVLKLNQIHPKLKMYSIRFNGSFEFNFDIAKKVAQTDADRQMIAQEAMSILHRFIENKRNELGLPAVA